MKSPPTNAWLLIGDEASFPTRRELQEMRRGGRRTDQLWTAPRQAQPGDLLFFYFVDPRKAIYFAARAASYPFFDPSIGVNAVREVNANQWWVEHTPLVELTPVSMSELREMMGGHLILRGRPTHYLPPAVAREILRRARKGRRHSEADAAVLQQPVGSAELPDPARPSLPAWRGMADGALLLESQVEQYVVEPLLRLVLPERATLRWQKAYRLESGGVPDYVIFDSDGPTSVIEVKLGVRVPRNGDWSRSPDFDQVSRYARELDVPAALIDSNRIFLIQRGATAPLAIIERRHASDAALKAIGTHLTGRPITSPASGPPEPRPGGSKQRRPAQRGAGHRPERPRAPIGASGLAPAPADEPRHILLTWNPGPGNDEQWTPRQWRAVAARIQAGERITGNWSVSNRRHNIEPGDIGCLFRQGEHGRGIVAVGEIRSEPYEDVHWAGAGVTNYVDIEWTHAMDLNGITLETLEAGAPSFSWRRVYSSGREVAGRAANELQSLIASTLGQ